ncbi:probable prolyl 4-hydroxylase 9 isoform X1 [Arachis ipaensis]|uniref:probable prolyl 4-hydroxylase 9 isoform X1 n=1 Tax=Arachis ipaensis TaxID=130454 RepID=UPI000A2AF4E0|nr:probable prolyl 4-hydroxylase 9 isoform X1 [Arachis ipaensis]XP_025627468.1 probable prolyl 4-hydroxylase 9 isoform X1 [Arachis hypogaea]
MKVKTVKGNWSLRTNKLGFPYVFLICIFFFLAGFFGSALFFHSQDDGHGMRPGPRLLESTKEETEYNLLLAGESGDDSITSIPFQVLSWQPRALYFPNFATAEQCESIVDIAKAGLKPSTLALRKGETEENTKGIRTSSGVFISASEDKTGTLEVIEEKIARATMIPRSHGEAFNILRYEIGQRYNSHYDAFNPSEYGPQKSQRVASFLLYLTDVQEGGETMFPFEFGIIILQNGSNMDGSYSYESCIGLKVRPRQGDGLLFYSLFPNGTIDPTSLHGSCPVIKGEKWVATKWVRDQEQYD